MKHNKIHPWGKPKSESPNASTGPVTAEGKEISSKNALKHGCTSTNTRILPTEKIEDYQALEAIWFRGYQPKDAVEIDLLHALVEAEWFLKRANQAYCDKEAAIYAETPNPGNWTEEQQRSIGRFLRYRTTHTNTAAKARKAVETYRRCRQLEQARDQAMRHKEERLILAKTKVEILAKKQPRRVQAQTSSESPKAAAFAPIAATVSQTP